LLLLCTMATEEARALLDSLMGGDRNATLPPGAAIPSLKKRDAGGQLLLPGKKQKSCYDKDIDPLYTAWGVDVYELFVNTKSDLGTNPYVVDEGAHKEFQKLPPHEQERLGFYYFLFQKLQELVRQCDRTVMRNKEKLAQELNRKLSQRGGQDFVEDVDEGALEHLARGMIQSEELTKELDDKLKELDETVLKQEEVSNKLEPLLEEKNKQESGDGDDNENESKEIKKEDDTEDSTVKQEEDDGQSTVKQENGDSSTAIKQEESEDKPELQQLQMELGKLTLQKQRVVYEVARILSRLAPLQEQVETQARSLNYVKSDISTDKTVCEVSGNFMSARDADERIAAHYAGKQYVGWKLVRDKFAEMQKTYGRYGPPPPAGRPDSGPPRGGFGGGGRGYGGGGYDRGGRGRFDGGGSRGDRGGRWERHGPGYQDRGRQGSGGGSGPPPPRGGYRR